MPFRVFNQKGEIIYPLEVTTVGKTIFLDMTYPTHSYPDGNNCWFDPPPKYYSSNNSIYPAKPVSKQKKLNVKAKFDPKYRSFWTKQHKEG